MFDYFKKRQEFRSLKKNQEELRQEMLDELKNGALFSESKEYEFLFNYFQAYISLLTDEIQITCPFKKAERIKAIQAQIEMMNLFIKDIDAAREYVKNDNLEASSEV